MSTGAGTADATTRPHKDPQPHDPLQRSKLKALLRSTMDENEAVELRRTTSSSSSSSADEDDDSAEFLNELEDDGDVTALSLLKRIFPPEEAADTEALRRQHLAFCNSLSTEYASADDSAAAEEEDESMETCKKSNGKSVVLPDDFLRLPSTVAVRRQINNKWQYFLVEDLERCAIAQHERIHGDADGDGSMEYVTKVVHRDPQSGLGMSLVENRQGVVLVHSVAGDEMTPGKKDRHDDHDDTMPTENDGVGGPACRAGVQRGDVLVGINGAAIVETLQPNSDSLVQHAVSAIQSSNDPVVLHLQRPIHWQQHDHLLRTPPLPAVVYQQISATTPSLLDTSDLFSDDGVDETQSNRLDVSFASDLSSYSQATPVLKNSYKQHVPRFVRLLADRGAIHTAKDEMEAARMLQDFNFRARQWDEMVSFQIPSAGVFIPLAGVRKALSVRIVNTFQDGDKTAYTIWVYDVESGKEWYAPVRFLRDFEDLRTATLPLCPASIAQIPFPRSSRASLSLFRSPSRDETSIQRENKCRQLEFFLRSLCAMIYTEKLHPSMAEIAIHVQSFLGCDEQDFGGYPRPPETIECIDDPEASLKADELLQQGIRLRLKRSLQLYTYRLFLLESMGQLVGTFVDTARTQGPRLQEIEALEAEGRDVLKAQAMRELGRIQTFIDRLQELILEGCAEEFKAIARQPQYSAMLGLIQDRKGSGGIWDCLVREAVREQVEIEAYVPLRSVVSRWLVHGWRHEDMEIQFKIKELRKRPQEFFRIAKGEERPDWTSVSKILNEGVGLSTLPCVKLHAIVEAAKEIFRIFAQLQSKRDEPSDRHQVEGDSSKETHLGADDFLPIFIYCVVQAEMERPCALCVLLRTLCDRINKIGEVGYYLQTFEAAITHCQEIDLTEDREEMQSFLSVPLNDD